MRPIDVRHLGSEKVICAWEVDGVLVDPGPQSTEEKLLEALGDANVQAIVATHWHPDHWMSYDLVRGATKAPVHVHEAEVRIPPERIDARVKDGQEIRVGSARLQVIHTPGHTPGSICLYSPTHRLVIVGDVLQVIRRRLIGPSAFFSEDGALARRSLARLAELDVDTICLAHYPPWRQEVRATLTRLAAAGPRR